MRVAIPVWVYVPLARCRRSVLQLLGPMLHCFRLCVQIPFYYEAKLALAVYLWANGEWCFSLLPCCSAPQLLQLCNAHAVGLQRPAASGAAPSLTPAPLTSPVHHLPCLAQTWQERSMFTCAGSSRWWLPTSRWLTAA